jgi:glycosyltransferase involved in cell wall biosynthesis
VIGGWEQLVQEINEGFKARGHTTHVLTSLHGLDSPNQEDGISRLLMLEADLNHYRLGKFLGYRKRVRANLEITKLTINSFNPDVVFIHSMWNLNRGIAWIAEQLRPNRVVYYMADHWPYKPDLHTAYWKDISANPFLALAKKILGILPLEMVRRDNKKYSLNFQKILCVSQAIKNDMINHGGLDSGSMSIVYNGIDVESFKPAHRPSLDPIRDISLLYAGSLVSHKGVHTVIEAMIILCNQRKVRNIALSLIGAGHPDYERQLHAMVEREGLGNNVRFLGRIPREQMPFALREFDVLLFPSVWEEPLARIIQEAMATGLVVIGTTTGGTGELLVEGETGLTFDAEDSIMLADKIQKLVDDPELYKHLSENGRRVVEAKFNVSRMLDEMEMALADVVCKGDNLPLK